MVSFCKQQFLYCSFGSCCLLLLELDEVGRDEKEFALLGCLSISWKEETAAATEINCHERLDDDIDKSYLASNWSWAELSSIGASWHCCERFSCCCCCSVSSQLHAARSWSWRANSYFWAPLFVQLIPAMITEASREPWVPTFRSSLFSKKLS